MLGLQAAEDEAHGLEGLDESAAGTRIDGLKQQLESCRAELFDVYDQVPTNLAFLLPSNLR